MYVIVCLHERTVCSFDESELGLEKGLLSRARQLCEYSFTAALFLSFDMRVDSGNFLSFVYVRSFVICLLLSVIVYKRAKMAQWKYKWKL